MTSAGRVRSAVHAGRFYPASPVRLQAEVNEYLAAVSPPEGTVPKALIVPHAGYAYSGAVAASGFVRLAPAHAQLRRVVLVGPSHYEDFDGLAASSAEAFETPLGWVRLDPDALEQMRDLTQVEVFDGAHEPEHCLEVELPFLQEVLDDFTLVPLLVGRADPGLVAEVLMRLWGGPETCVVISSDLSHYLEYAAAQRKDEVTATEIARSRWERLDSQCACGHRAISGLLEIVRRHRLSCQVLDLRNSGDTGGTRERVVGYGAFAFAS